MKFLKLDTVRLNVTEIRPDASRHSALSQGHIVKLEQADSANVSDAMNMPKELPCREGRLTAMAAAELKIVTRG